MPARAERILLRLLCFILEHKLGKIAQMDARGVWSRCLRCKREIVRPLPRIIRRPRKHLNYAATK